MDKQLPSRINKVFRSNLRWNKAPNGNINRTWHERRGTIDRPNINNYLTKYYFSRKNRSKRGVIVLSEESFELKGVAVINLLFPNVIEKVKLEIFASSYIVTN